eukprot:327090-Hanusia_phi.AAC.1
MASSSLRRATLVSHLINLKSTPLALSLSLALALSLPLPPLPLPLLPESSPSQGSAYPTALACPALGDQRRTCDTREERRAQRDETRGSRSGGWPWLLRRSVSARSSRDFALPAHCPASPPPPSPPVSFLLHLCVASRVPKPPAGSSRQVVQASSLPLSARRARRTELPVVGDSDVLAEDAHT